MLANWTERALMAAEKGKDRACMRMTNLGLWLLARRARNIVAEEEQDERDWEYIPEEPEENLNAYLDERAAEAERS